MKIRKKIAGGEIFNRDFSFENFTTFGNEPTTLSSSGYYGQAYFNEKTNTLVVTHGGTRVQTHNQ